MLIEGDEWFRLFIRKQETGELQSNFKRKPFSCAFSRFRDRWLLQIRFSYLAKFHGTSQNCVRIQKQQLDWKACLYTSLTKSTNFMSLKSRRLISLVFAIVLQFGTGFLQAESPVGNWKGEWRNGSTGHKGPMRATIRQPLGPILGSYQMQAQVIGNRFDGNFQAAGDNGSIRMLRVR